MDLAELKANLAALQKGAAKLDSRDYIVPRRKVIFYDFLTDYDIDRYDCVYHLYLPAAPIDTSRLARSADTIFVIHNHGSNRSCTTPDFCHTVGYQPSELTHPGFRKAFGLKNAAYYSSVEVDSRSNSIHVPSNGGKGIGFDLDGLFDFPNS